MANIRSGNTFYIDTQYSSAADELAIPGIRVSYIFVSTPSSANQLFLVDSVTTASKVNSQNIESTRVFDFRSYPISFPNGIRPKTVTNCVATLVLIDPRS